MVHRDDHAAARARILALERDLDDARVRAEQAEQKAREAVARATAVEQKASSNETSASLRQAPRKKKDREKDARKHGKREKKARRNRERERADEVPAAGARGWPPRGEARYRRAIQAIVAVLYAPALVAILAVPIDDEASQIFGGIFAPVVLQVVLTYVVGRIYGAPYPSSGAMVTLLAGSIGVLALVMGASDLLWGDVCATGPLRWSVRGAVGAIAIAFAAIISSAWAAEASETELGGPD